MNKTEFISLIQINFTYIPTNVTVWLPQVSWMQNFISTALTTCSIYSPHPTALWPFTDHGLLIHSVYRSHTQQRTTVGRVISSSQRPLPDNTQHSQSQLASGCRTTPLDHAATKTGTICLTLSYTFLSREKAINTLKFQIFVLFLKIRCHSSSYAKSSIWKH